MIAHRHSAMAGFWRVGGQKLVSPPRQPPLWGVGGVAGKTFATHGGIMAGSLNTFNGGAF
jgi:hypothetical protein